MNNPSDILQNCLQFIPQAIYPLHSRVHPLHSFASSPFNCLIKREDELGFGISGSKFRKYRTLIPWLIKMKYEEVAVIGSANSNHVLSLTQLLIENNLRPALFLRGDPSYSLQGNCLLSSLLVPVSCIHWISKKEWKAVQSQAEDYASKQPRSAFVLPEGGTVAASLPGALTLPLDIIQNEKDTGIVFDHIFIEAGTGFTASALILGLSFLKHPAVIHVILLAGDQDSFLNQLKSSYRMFLDLLQTPVTFPRQFILHTPQITGKFGETSPPIFEFIRQFAQMEGILTDPIYSAKLFMEVKLILSKGSIKGNILFIHSGGGLSLMGFQDQLKTATSSAAL